MDGAGKAPAGGGQSDGKPWSENCVSNTLFPPQRCALLTLNQSPFNSVRRCPLPLLLRVFASPMNIQGKSWPQSSELGWSAGGPPWSPLGLAWTPALHQESAVSLPSAGHRGRDTDEAASMLWGSRSRASRSHSPWRAGPGGAGEGAAGKLTVNCKSRCPGTEACPPPRCIRRNSSGSPHPHPPLRSDSSHRPALQRSFLLSFFHRVSPLSVCC